MTVTLWHALVSLFFIFVMYNNSINFTTTWELGYVMSNEQQFYVLCMLILVLWTMFMLSYFTDDSTSECMLSLILWTSLLVNNIC